MKKKIVAACLAALCIAVAAGGIIPGTRGNKQDNSSNHINAPALVNALAAGGEAAEQAELAEVNYPDSVIAQYSYEEGAEYGTVSITISDAYKDTYNDEIKTLIIVKPDKNGEKADVSDVPAASLVAIEQDSEITSVPMPILNSAEDAGVYTVLMGGSEGKIYEGTFEISSEQSVSPTPTSAASEEASPTPSADTTPEPTPSIEVTTEPTGTPSVDATTEPTGTPSIDATTEPTGTPSADATPEPSDAPVPTETTPPQTDTFIELISDTTALSDGTLTGSVSARVVNTDKSAQLILAVYDEGGRLKNVQIRSASGDVEFDELNIAGVTGYSYSIFAWENMTTQNPLCEAYTQSRGEYVQ